MSSHGVILWYGIEGTMSNNYPGSICDTEFVNTKNVLQMLSHHFAMYVKEIFSLQYLLFRKMQTMVWNMIVIILI